MAANTDIKLRNKVIYSVYVRNHTHEGTFAGVEADLDRISSLGVDIIWFMPIHPIGEKNRKGDMGCPYAIRDYRGVNPEYGTPEDFKRLAEAIRKNGMKCMIDVVYNHTSPDSMLTVSHPEWFYKKPGGGMGGKTADWTDVVDLDYTNRGLWDYQIETLCEWAKIVDGFRCDVAPLVPVEFWLAARKAVEEIKPDFVWLAETVHPSFILENRAFGFTAHSDCEMYAAFDICYDYDVMPAFHGAVRGKGSLSRYAELVSRQEFTYPANYIKLRNLENHDNPRAAELFTEPATLENWTVFNYLQKGTALIYAGQERCDANTPSLFGRDLVNWDGKDLTELYRKLTAIKREPIFRTGAFHVSADDETGIAVSRYQHGKDVLVVAACLTGKPGTARVELPDGTYEDMLGGGFVNIKSGKVELESKPVVIKCNI